MLVGATNVDGVRDLLRCSEGKSVRAIAGTGMQKWDRLMTSRTYTATMRGRNAPDSAG